MKKKILMIGNTDGLPGVPVDIDAYYSFFTSPIGGAWCDDEIDIMLNPTQRCVFNKIVEIEESRYDYVITIFLGHGAEMDYGTILKINEREVIGLHHLMNLSPKQIIIAECCRKPVQMPADLAFANAGATMLSMSRDPIRQAYEDRIRDCPPQKIILFACDTDEKAKGSSDGGRYSSYLLQAAHMTLIDSHSPFASVNRVHRAVVSMMQEKPHILQHPQIYQSRCPINRRLPLAVNTKLWGIYE